MSRGEYNNYLLAMQQTQIRREFAAQGPAPLPLMLIQQHIVRYSLESTILWSVWYVLGTTNMLE